MKKKLIWLVCLMLIASTAPLAGANPDKVQAKRQAIDSMARAAMDRLLSESEVAKKLAGHAVAYAAFDNVKVALGVSGGGGVGVAVDLKTRRRTYMKMGTAGIGLGLGGQSYQLVLMFADEETFRRFVEKGWQADASANAVAWDAGKNAEATFTHGVAVFQLTNKGLMAQADISGTKYWKYKKLNKR